MSSEWESVRLGDLCTKIGSGATPKGGNAVYLHDGVSLIRSQNVLNGEFRFDGLARIGSEHAEQLAGVTAREGDVLLNITGDSVARACRMPRDALPARVNQHVAIVRPDAKRLDSRFLQYVLVSPSMQRHLLGLAAAGATRKALTKSMIENLTVAAAPLAEQRRIASVLGALDDKIELNRRMNETLQGVVELHFARIWSSDPAAASVSEEFIVTMGQSPPGESYNESGEGIPFFQGRADFGFRYPAARIYCTAPTRFAQARDTLVSVRAPVGDVNMALTDCAIGRGVAAVRHRSGSRSFTYYAMRRLRSAFEVFESEGTVFGSLSKKDFAALKVPAVSTEAVARFEEFAKPFDDRIETNTRESRTLAALRDSLLPKLISGGIRVRGAEKAVDAAT